LSTLADYHAGVGGELPMIQRILIIAAISAALWAPIIAGIIELQP
jgi:hypothetical protein